MASANREDNWFLALDQALESGPRMVEGSEEFNRACYHIVRLLLDATRLFRNDYWSTATFLAITALEETAKVHVGLHRKARSEVVKKRRNDPLYNHSAKHLLAAAPTIPMGSRLGAAIGDHRVEELMKLASSGQLVALRESCLYFERRTDELVIPEEVVSKEYSKELLLFALETFDDALVGLTNYSYSVAKTTDELFAELANS